MALEEASATVLTMPHDSITYSQAPEALGYGKAARRAILLKKDLETQKGLPYPFMK